MHLLRSLRWNWPTMIRTSVDWAMLERSHRWLWLLKKRMSSMVHGPWFPYEFLFPFMRTRTIVVCLSPNSMPSPKISQVCILTTYAVQRAISLRELPCSQNGFFLATLWSTKLHSLLSIVMNLRWGVKGGSKSFSGSWWFLAFMHSDVQLELAIIFWRVYSSSDQAVWGVVVPSPSSIFRLQTSDFYTSTRTIITSIFPGPSASASIISSSNS